MQLGFRKGEERVAQRQRENKARRLKMQAASMSTTRGGLFAHSSAADKPDKQSVDIFKSRNERDTESQPMGAMSIAQTNLLAASDAARNQVASSQDSDLLSKYIREQRGGRNLKATASKRSAGGFDKKRSSGGSQPEI